jgi:hypothetical protein
MLRAAAAVLFAASSVLGVPAAAQAASSTTTTQPLVIRIVRSQVKLAPDGAGVFVKVPFTGRPLGSRGVQP